MSAARPPVPADLAAARAMRALGEIAMTGGSAMTGRETTDPVMPVKSLGDAVPPRDEMRRKDRESMMADGDRLVLQIVRSHLFPTERPRRLPSRTCRRRAVPSWSRDSIVVDVAYHFSVSAYRSTVLSTSQRQQRTSSERASPRRAASQS